MPGRINLLSATAAACLLALPGCGTKPAPETTAPREATKAVRPTTAPVAGVPAPSAPPPAPEPPPEPTPVPKTAFEAASAFANAVDAASEKATSDTATWIRAEAMDSWNAQFDTMLAVALERPGITDETRASIEKLPARYEAAKQAALAAPDLDSHRLALAEIIEVISTLQKEIPPGP